MKTIDKATQMWIYVTSKDKGGAGTQCNADSTIEIWIDKNKMVDVPVSKALQAVNEWELLNAVAEAADIALSIGQVSGNSKSNISRALEALSTHRKAARE